MSKLVSKRQKLYNIAGIDMENPDANVPIRRLTSMENATFKNGKLGRFDHAEELKDKFGRDIPPTPRLIYKIIQYSGKNGNQNILIASGSYGVYKYDINTDSEWVLLIDEEIAAIECISINGLPVIYMPTYLNSYLYDGVKCEAVKSGTTKHHNLYIHMTTHYGRLFGATGMNDCKLFFSDESDPLDWSVGINEGGYIKFDINTGPIVGLVSFNDYLYVFTRRAIYRITAYGVQEDFVVKKIDENIGEIYENSVSKSKDRIMFLSTLGVVAFDGYSAKVIYPELAKIEFDKFLTDIRSCSLNNKYYLALGTNIIIIDQENACYCIDDYNYNVGVASDTVNNRVIVYTKHNPGAVSGNIMECYVAEKRFTSRLFKFESGMLDFGNDSAKKIIKKIHIAPEVRGAFIIKADNEMRCFNLYGDKTIPINMSGYRFKIIFRGMALSLNTGSPVIEYDIEA